jgi:hypothetical protein
MDIKERLKTLLQEAELYRSQGLINEARSKFENAAELISGIANLKNKESLLQAIHEKTSALDSVKSKVDLGPSKPELSKKAQDLIKNLFTFSENKDAASAALEGAVALAKFGQFDRALTELNTLLNKEAVRVEAAKNILRCHLAVANPEEAIDQYHKWYSSELFLPSQMETVRIYLEDILKKKGLDVTLPSPLSVTQTQGVQTVAEVASVTESEEEFLDITSIGITFDSGARKGQMVEFDVNFQSGNMLSLIISKKDQDVIDGLKTGSKLKDMQFYSPIAIFNGAGVVSSKTQIKSGPKQGDFCLDIRISSK